MNAVQTEFRKVRILHLAFMTTIFLYLYMLIAILRPPVKAVQPLLVIAFGALAAMDLGVALTLRARQVRASEERLRNNPGDRRALQQWRVGMITSFAFAETHVLFGFLLKFLGADWKIAGPFFAFGVLLMLLWTPRLDVPAMNQ
jgi:hypothetical protein